MNELIKALNIVKDKVLTIHNTYVENGVYKDYKHKDFEAFNKNIEFHDMLDNLLIKSKLERGFK